MKPRPVTKSKSKPKGPSYIFEPFPWQEIQESPVIGVDEVGRGCLAGPVYAAAVVLNPGKDNSQYTDSKTLSAARREELAERVKAEHMHGIGFATVEEIDRLNILRASLLAMRRAVLALKVESGHLLVDGTFQVPSLPGFRQTCLVKGDLRAAPVGAASIVAKVARDAYMTGLEGAYPLYGFAAHKGYSTQAHQDAIRTHGPCAVHRRTFAGVKEYLSPAPS